MGRITENDVEKLGLGIRVLAGIFFICTLVAAAWVIYAIFTEPFDPMILIYIVVCIIGGHVSGKVTFTGYAPTYLLFAHAPKKDI